MGVERESLQDESARERFLGANLSESLHYYAVHSNWQRERERERASEWPIKELWCHRIEWCECYPISSPVTNSLTSSSRTTTVC